MIFESPEQSLTLTRGDFDEATFRRLIAQKGLTLRWTQSSECPCKPKSIDNGIDLRGIDDIDSGVDNSVACPVCKGKGLIYHSPQNVQAIVTAAEGEYLNVRFGGYREGLINITLNPEHLPCFGDRFELTQSVMLYRESVEVTDAPNVSLRFPIASRDLTLKDGPTTLDIIYAHRTDEVTGLALVDGDITNTDVTTYYSVVDGDIVWDLANKPPVGSRVSFSYFIHPTYTVVSYPNSIRDTKVRKKSPTDAFVPMVVKVQAKLEFLEPQG